MPFLLAIIRKIFGESLYAIHVLPAICNIIYLIFSRQEDAKNQKDFKKVFVVGKTYNKYNPGNNKFIYLAKDLRTPVKEFWLKQKDVNN